MIRFDDSTRHAHGRRAVLPAAVLLLAAAQVQAGGTPLTWPGAAPCNTTLQACLDGVPDGSSITVVTSTPIDESVTSTDRTFGLRAEAGRDVRFAPGRNLIVNVTPAGGDVAVHLDGLQFTNGAVLFSHASPATSTFTARRLRMTQSAADAPGAYVGIRASAGTVEADVSESHFVGKPLFNTGLVTLQAVGAALNARVFHNTFDSLGDGTGGGAGIFVDYVGLLGVAGSGRSTLHGNVLRGVFGRAGIFFSEGLFSSTAAQFDALAYNNVVIGPEGGGVADDGIGGTGIALAAGVGSIDAQLINNTLSRVRNGISISPWNTAADTAAVDGVVANNLIAGYTGLSVNEIGLAAVPDNHHNLLDVVRNAATLGPSTSLVPAQLVSREKPRLRDGSPAIDAADSTVLGLGLIFAQLPTTDADGLRRFKGAGTAPADIGAYEWGDQGFAHVARAGNTLAHITTLSNRATNSAPNAWVFAQAARNATAPLDVPYDAPLGVYWRPATATWAAFSENFAPVPSGARLHVFVPSPGHGLLHHEATPDTMAPGQNYTRVEASGLDDLGDRVVIVTQNHEPNNVYNPHPIGLLFNTTHWFIDNVDGAEMPVGASFNVYYQPPSPNAFHVRPVAGAEVLALPHPLLDGNACARPLVTRQYDGDTSGGGYRLRYVNDGWRIDAVGSTFDDETIFHVLVDAPRADPCDPPLFADGFESG